MTDARKDGIADGCTRTARLRRRSHQCEQSAKQGLDEGPCTLAGQSFVKRELCDELTGRAIIVISPRQLLSAPSNTRSVLIDPPSQVCNTSVEYVRRASSVMISAPPSTSEMNKWIEEKVIKKTLEVEFKKTRVATEGRSKQRRLPMAQERRVPAARVNQLLVVRERRVPVGGVWRRQYSSPRLSQLA